MIRRTVTIAFALSASAFATQSALALQDPAFGYDPYHRFGYERPAAASTAQKRDTSHLYRSTASHMPGYEVYYVYGSDAREFARSASPRTAMQIRDALGIQAGA